MQEEIKNWEKELTRLLDSLYIPSGAVCGKTIKSFIHQLLKEEREKGEFENVKLIQDTLKAELVEMIKKIKYCDGSKENCHCKTDMERNIETSKEYTINKILDLLK